MEQKEYKVGDRVRIMDHPNVWGKYRNAKGTVTYVGEGLEIHVLLDGNHWDRNPMPGESDVLEKIGIKPSYNIKKHEI